MAETTHETTEGGAGHGHGGHGAHDAKEHEKHYRNIYLVLLGLLVVSVIGPEVAGALDETTAFWVVLITAFGIAFVKAWLVIKHFMHATQEPRYIAYISITALALMGLMFFWVAPDVMRHEGHNWVNLSAMAATGERPPAVHAGTFDAEQAFQTVCASCHGSEGKGDGPAAAALNPKPASFASAEFWATRDEEHIATVIREGGPAVGASPLMAAFGDQYTDRQITGIVDYMVGEFRPDSVPDAAPVEVEDEPTEVAAPEGEGEAAAPEPAEGEEAEPTEVAEAEPEAEAPAEPEPAEPAGPSPAERARQADYITGRLYR